MYQALDEYIQSWKEKHQAVSLAVGISIEGERVFEKGYGPLGIEMNEETTPDTIYGVASVTKSFTALAILMLEERGLLSIDDAVTNYLPEFKLPGLSEQEISEIKIKHLLSHSTGLAPVPRNEGLIKLGEHLRYLADVQVPILGKPGVYVSYCNDTFLLLGAIIQRVTGQLYRRFATVNILEKLQMNRSTYSLEEVSRLYNVSVPYNLVKGEHQQAEWPTLGNYEVGGGVRSNIRDLLTYAEVFGLQQEATLAHLGISKQRLQSMWQNGVAVDDQGWYGYALDYQQVNDFTIVCHGGGQPGVSSIFGFIPEKKICVAVLCNVGGLPVKELFLKALEAATGDDLSAYQQPKGEKLSKENVNQIIQDQQLLGRYSAAEGYKLDIVHINNQIVVKTDLFEEEAILYSPNLLYLPQSKRKLPLFIREDKVWALRFGLRMLVKEGEGYAD